MKNKPRKKNIPLSILINHCKQELMNVIVIFNDKKIDFEKKSKLYKETKNKLIKHSDMEEKDR